MTSILILIGLVGGVYVLKKLEKEIELMGLSKKELKIIIGIIILFFLYKNYKNVILQTNILASDHRIGLIKSHI